jgi:hypothetical protein
MKTSINSNGESVIVLDETRNLVRGTQHRVIYSDGSGGWEHEEDLIDNERLTYK